MPCKIEKKTRASDIKNGCMVNDISLATLGPSRKFNFSQKICFCFVCLTFIVSCVNASLAVLLFIVCLMFLLNWFLWLVLICCVPMIIFCHVFRVACLFLLVCTTTLVCSHPFLFLALPPPIVLHCPLCSMHVVTLGKERGIVPSLSLVGRAGR